MCVKSAQGINRCKNLRQSGQAILEYLFIIFFVIVLVSGFVYQFNGAVKNLFNSYFSADGYLACLIQKGLLPGETNDEGTCSLPSFDMNSAPQRKVASINFPKGTSPTFNAQGGGPGSGGSSSSRIDERGGANVVPYDAAGGVTTKGGGKGEVTKKGPNTGSDGISSSHANGLGSSGDDGADGGERYVPYVGGGYSTNATAKKATTVPASGRDLKTQRELAAEKKLRKEAGNKEASRFDLSFGNIMKWFVIILLLFGIIFFIGSQIVAVSRGNKKSR